jgi:cysteate synthase
MPSNSVSSGLYRLRCSECGASYGDDDYSYRLRCDAQHRPSFLRSTYVAQQFMPGSAATIARYERWLPALRSVTGLGRAGVYRSEKLGLKLGLPPVWIAFGGWWPGRNATLPNGAVADLLATAAFARVPDDDDRPLVVAAAGPLAVSFASVATTGNHPLLLIVNPDGLRSLGNAGRIGGSVRTVLVADGSAEDVVRFADEIGRSESFIREGGLANVARRDGAGTMLLAAIETMGMLPDVYVQSIGEGAGVLGVYETAQRLVSDGRYGTVAPRLILGQRAPETFIHDAWTSGDADVSLGGRAHSLSYGAPTSFDPAYDTRGVYDALIASGGRTVAVSRDEVLVAQRLFSDVEQMDIDTESGVALAALIAGLRSKVVDRTQTILLGITGGGHLAIRRERRQIRPDVAVTRGASPDVVGEQLATC